MWGVCGVDALQSIKSAVYEAAFRPALPQLLSKLARATRSDGVAFHIHDLRGDVGGEGVFHNVDTVAHELYQREYAKDNVLIQRCGPDLASGTIRRVGEILPEREFHRSRYYAEFLRTFDLHHCLGLCVLREASVLSVLSLMRGHRRIDYEDQHKLLMQRVMPHLQRAVVVRQHLAGRDITSQASFEALHFSGIALIALSAGGQVTLCTEAAQRVFARADGLRLDSDGLGAINHALTPR